MKFRNFILAFLVTLAIGALLTLGGICAFGQEAAGADGLKPALPTATTWWTYLLPVIVPMLIAAAKSVLMYWGAKIPSSLIPLLAVGLGVLIDWLTTRSGGDFNPALGAALGASGVGLREIVDQLNKARAARTASALLLIGVMGWCMGCASVRQSATTTTVNPTNGVETITEAKSSITAWGDAKAVVDKVRASAGKTSSVGASGVSEETTSAGLQTMMQMMLNAAVELGKMQAAGK